MKTKRIFAISFLLLFLFLFIAPTTYSASAATTSKTEPRVYITTYGDCYHSSSCQYLYKSKTAIGKYKAQSLGYYACSVCGGISSGYIVEYYYSENSSSPSYNYPKTSSSKSKSKSNGTSLEGIVVIGVFVFIGGCVLFNFIRAIIEEIKAKRK